MPLVQIVVLALMQGATEFLPISSSGHLALVPHVTGWPDQGLAFDVAVHVGTLGAVVVYTWREIVRMLADLVLPRRNRQRSGHRLALHLVVASIPVIIAGFLVSAFLGDGLRSVETIAWATVIFAVLLGLADRYGITAYRLEHMTVSSALFVGAFQALALIPGASRSGTAMTAARIVGLERREAALFSLLLGIPAVLGAGTLTALRLYQAGDTAITPDAVLAAGIAFVTALLSIVLMMAWLRRAGFMPFVAYRLVLGGLLLYWVYS